MVRELKFNKAKLKDLTRLLSNKLVNVLNYVLVI